VGEGKGIGSTINVPWPENCVGDNDYISAFNLIVLPVLIAWAPDLMLVSAGFDAVVGDAQGRMEVTPAGFGQLTTMLMEAVRCPLVLALEGGYNAPATSQCCASVLRALLHGADTPSPPPKMRLHRCCEPTIRAVLKVQEAYWPVLRQQAEPSRLAAYFKQAEEGVQASRASKRSRTDHRTSAAHSQEGLLGSASKQHGAVSGASCSCRGL